MDIPFQREQAAEVPHTNLFRFKFVKPDDASRPFLVQVEVGIESRTLTDPERQLVTFVNKTFKWASEHATGKSEKSREIAKQREEFIKCLQGIIVRLGEGEGTATKLLIEVARARGTYNALRQQIRQRYEVNFARDVKGNVVDFDFGGMSRLTAEQERFLTEIKRTWTIVSVVLGRKDPLIGSESSGTRARLPIINWLRRSQVASKKLESLDEDSLTTRSYYLHKLGEVARLGLSSDGVRFANALLDGFKDEFVAREADSVKNRYVGRLGRHALVIGGSFMAAYAAFQFLLPTVCPSATTASLIIAAFMAMAAAACGGTWLSFSLRRVVLGFSDLANLEDDRLNPTGRLFFVVGLTVVVALFFDSGILHIKLGEATDNLLNLNTALLLGVVCGISERALASAVSRRADNIVTKLSV